ncbi:MAG: ABC transporter permease [Candidatus Omnitrophica bacterium]|nr:ABC transporter permease [Candidatus Omnitrophota bacterium]MDD5610664.1 ABC transporter permease [Candidatus Omnitrophota bacterium]
MNARRINTIAKKEFIQIIRDYRSLALAIFIPVLLLILFGFALSMDVDNVPMIIWNQDNSQVSTDFILNFKNSRYFNIVGYSDNYGQLQNYIDRKQAIMAMVIPKDFSKYIQSANAAPVQLLVDGSDSNTATIAMGYVNSIVAKYNAAFISNTLSRLNIQNVYGIELRPRIWFNENLESRNYIIPGLIAVIMMIIAAQLTSITVAREWERGTMEQLISTPVRRNELIFGKLIPYFMIGFLDLLIAVAMGQFVFNVPLRGSLTLLLVLSSIFLIGALAQGIYFSIFAKNQRLAMQLGILTTFLPTFLLSGFVYPIYNMPKVIQLVTYLVPARYFISILKGIYLKGDGLAILWRQAFLLTLFAAAMVYFAYRQFQKKVT